MADPKTLHPPLYRGNLRIEWIEGNLLGKPSPGAQSNPRRTKWQVKERVEIL